MTKVQVVRIKISSGHRYKPFRRCRWAGKTRVSSETIYPCKVLWDWRCKTKSFVAWLCWRLCRGTARRSKCKIFRFWKKKSVTLLVQFLLKCITSPTKSWVFKDFHATVKKSHKKSGGSPDSRHLEYVPLDRGIKLGQIDPDVDDVATLDLVYVPQINLRRRNKVFFCFVLDSFEIRIFPLFSLILWMRWRIQETPIEYLISYPICFSSIFEQTQAPI